MSISVIYRSFPSGKNVIFSSLRSTRVRFTSHTNNGHSISVMRLVGRRLFRIILRFTMSRLLRNSDVMMAFAIEPPEAFVASKNMRVGQCNTG